MPKTDLTRAQRRALEGVLRHGPLDAKGGIWALPDGGHIQRRTVEGLATLGLVHGCAHGSLYLTPQGASLMERQPPSDVALYSRLRAVTWKG